MPEHFSVCASDDISESKSLLWTFTLTLSQVNKHIVLTLDTLMQCHALPLQQLCWDNVYFLYKSHALLLTSFASLARSAVLVPSYQAPVSGQCAFLPSVPLCTQLPKVIWGIHSLRALESYHKVIRTNWKHGLTCKAEVFCHLYGRCELSTPLPGTAEHRCWVIGTSAWDLEDKMEGCGWSFAHDLELMLCTDFCNSVLHLLGLGEH